MASLLRSLVTKKPRTLRRLDGLVVVPCEGADRDVCALWDPVEEQIVDFVPASKVGRYAAEDDLWAEGRGWTELPAYEMAA